MKKSVYLIFLIVFYASCCGAQHCAQKVENVLLKNLWKVSEDVYRSEQPNKKNFAALEKYGIKSILNLRSNHNDSKAAVGTSLKLFSVKLQAGKLNDDSVMLALKILIQSPKPILVHCKHGSDRTGLLIALYRIVVENKTKEEAIKELTECGYGFHKMYDNIPEYIMKVDVEKMKKVVFSK